MTGGEGSGRSLRPGRRVCPVSLSYTVVCTEIGCTVSWPRRQRRGAGWADGSTAAPGWQPHRSFEAAEPTGDSAAVFRIGRPGLGGRALYMSATFWPVIVSHWSCINDVRLLELAA